MRNDGARGGQAITRPLARVPVQVRLAAAALCLLAAGASIISAVSVLMARAYLTRQADQQLRAYADLLTSRPFTTTPGTAVPGDSGSAAFVIEVLGTGDQLLMQAGPNARAAPAAGRIPVRSGQLSTVPAGSGGGSWLVVTEPVHYRAKHLPYTYGYDSFSLVVTSTARPGVAGTLIAALDLSGASQAIGSLTVTCVAVSGAMILAIAFLGVVVIRAILRPLTQIEETAAAVAAGDLSRRVSDGHAHSKAGRPAQPLNRMLSQIEHAYNARAGSEAAALRSTEQMRGVIADTSHELQRPLSVIRGFAEYYQQHGQLRGAEVDRMMKRVSDEVAHMEAFVDDLPSSRPDRHQGMVSRSAD